MHHLPEKPTRQAGTARRVRARVAQWWATRLSQGEVHFALGQAPSIVELSKSCPRDEVSQMRHLPEKLSGRTARLRICRRSSPASQVGHLPEKFWQARRGL